MTCCVTGHRPQKFPFPYDDHDARYRTYLAVLETEIRQLIKEGYDTFLSGMAYGVDLDFARIVCDIRDTSSGAPLFLEAALPYPLAKGNRSIREELSTRANTIHVVSPCYHGGCMQRRNRFMVNRSDLVLAVWNGEPFGGTWNTIQYAKSIHKPIRYVMLNELENT